jgi:hypothetical protein
MHPPEALGFSHGFGQKATADYGSKNLTTSPTDFL